MQFQRWFFVLAICFANSAGADTTPHATFTVISELRNAIYVTREKSGGSDAEWDALETNAASQMQALIARIGLNDQVLNQHGQTPLHAAAANGFDVLVEIILASEAGRNWIDKRDQRDLSAFEHAHLALPETLLACHPKIDNPFVLVPFVVKTPYYQSRTPFTNIQNMLTEAGAENALTSAKGHWLEHCSNPDQALRAQVEASDNLYGLLKEASLAIDHARRLKEVEEQVSFLIELTKLMPKAKRASDAELRDQINQIYRNNGLEPPQH